METKIIEGYTVDYFENIFIIHSILDDAFCDKCIELIDKLPLEKQIYSDSNNVKCFTNKLNDLLHVDDSLFYEFSANDDIYNRLLQKSSQNNLYNNLLNGYHTTDIKDILKPLIYEKSLIIKNIVQSFNGSIGFDFNSGFIIRKIFGKTRLHTDGLHYDKSFNLTYNQMFPENRFINMNTLIVRSASAVFTLNDNYNGGEFKFPGYDISIKLKKGSVIIFPPYWTHKHETNDILDDTYRYTINTWYGEILPKK